MRRRMSATVILLALVALPIACNGQVVDGPSDPPAPPPPPPPPPPPTGSEARLALVAAGLSTPVFLTAPPGDATRLFIVEKTGRIRIVKNGSLLARPFLDIRDSVTGESEQGLLGLAFHPSYATNRRFVVSYTTGGTTGGGRSRIARYTATAVDPDSADPGSAQVILHVDQPFSNHNGGQVTFGPDGFLYVSLGDGGSGGDPQGFGQRRDDLLGSLLRLDLDGGTPYAIPSSNPYAQSSTLRRELWNYGLRNPWRFSFDRTTGDLYIGDVGQNQREEIDFAPASSTGGENYGWNIIEGMRCYPNGGSCNQVGLTAPVLDYDHGSNGGCSVTGGYVYRGTAISAIRGHYFYADYCRGWVRSFRMDAGRAVDLRDWPALAPGGSVTSFGEDAQGELYILTSDGRVQRFVPSP